MNIKSIWLYTALAACLGSGYGIRAATSPSQAEMEQAVMQARQHVGLRPDCEISQAEREWKNPRFRNHQSKGF